MDRNTDFDEDFKIKYSDDDLIEVNELILKALESDKPDSFTGKKWTLSSSIEKHDRLNHTYHIDLEIEGDTEESGEICLSFYTGIDVGCELVDYSFSGTSIANSPLMQRVLVDLIPDMEAINLNLSEGVYASEKRSTIVLNANKKSIMEIYAKQNYDNYHTGGGTLKTDSHYKSEFDRFHSMGLYWTCVYDEVEVDRNFI